jgi:serine/threonine-protein kinase
MASSDMDHRAPSGLVPHFVRVRPIARGGMGSVELVLRREGSFRRLYAIKRLLPHLQDDESVRVMFLDEARVAGLVRHPNVVSVLDYGEDDDGPFLVMDYVEGMSLGNVLRITARRMGRIPLQIALRIMAQACEGLHAAHEVNAPDGSPLELVHRDLSPQNILVGFDGVVRVTDFGVAKALGQSNATAEGVLKGKFGYMSPEQLRFEPLDRRSDLFSLGVVLYEVLSGERLYGNGTDGVRALLDAPPPDIGDERPDVPPAIVELSVQLLAKDPARRPATAREVARRLERVLAQDIAAHGSTEMDEFMRAHFADEAAALREADSAASGHALSGTVPEPRRPPRGRVALGMVLAIVLLGGAVAIYAARDTDEAERHVTVPDVAPPVAAQAHERSPAPALASEMDERATEEQEAAESEAATVAPREARPDRRRRRSQSRRAATADEPASSSDRRIPQWGWEVQGAAMR